MQDGEEFPCACVAAVVVEVVAEARLLETVAAGDDVQKKPAVRDALERCRLMRDQCRGNQSRPESDEELQPIRFARKRRRGDPCVFAPCSRRREDGMEILGLGRARDLGQIGKAGSPMTSGKFDEVAIVARAGEAATVAVGRKIPVKMNSAVHAFAPADAVL